MPSRHRLCLTTDLPPGCGLECVAGDRIVAVFNVEGRFFALDGICPHAGGPLAKGELHGCIVTCPWHGWQFDVTTGRHQLSARIQQPSLPVVIEGDELYVELP
jgi:nitrite reductase (NADH) small subunit